MTQDQYGQARDSGYVVPGQIVGDQTDKSADEQDKPMTRFQKVASALRGDRPDRDEPDADARDQALPDQAGTASIAPEPYGTGPGETEPAGTYPKSTYPNSNDAALNDAALNDAALNKRAPDPNGARPDGTVTAGGAGAPRDDYWNTLDASGTGRGQVAAVTSPDVPVTDTAGNPLERQDEAVGQHTGNTQEPTPTEPDLYGIGTRADAENPAATATIPDVPVTQTPEAPGGAGRHAAATAQDGPGMRPGEAAGTVESLGDLAYADLLPDASVYTEQWQQIQFKFVDDPHTSVTEAADVVAQVTAKLEAAIQERQRAIEARQQAIQDQQRSLRGR
jgi:hypothetical protein